MVTFPNLGMFMLISVIEELLCNIRRVANVSCLVRYLVLTRFLFGNHQTGSVVAQWCSSGFIAVLHPVLPVLLPSSCPHPGLSPCRPHISPLSWSLHLLWDCYWTHFLLLLPGNVPTRLVLMIYSLVLIQSKQ